MALFNRGGEQDVDLSKGALPQHIAVIMDGNGRWAKKRMMPRIYGHKKGVDALRDVIRACDELNVAYLTVFAFSSENWRRPAEEVSFLMGLFLQVLDSEIERMMRNNIRLKIIGCREKFSAELVELIMSAEAKTASNTGLCLTIAADYGGHWDILNATRALLQAQPELVAGFDEDAIKPYLAMAYAPDPDLFIRTGGEQRISNFLLWQLAYTELYFTDLAWPEFGRTQLRESIAWYQQRERRFGRISEQLSE
ncbi:isoprenyl transferase [Chitinibacter fontanus]|uniref:Isoprenyl transferase n=1 Tax=Chitinibacter fontanus TaxID=1737446 RepID=A0A7D5ZDW3_9NEIS|nr:isoprenyl transferase [Chitinibacter fontanus]